MHLPQAFVVNMSLWAFTHFCEHLYPAILLRHFAQVVFALDSLHADTKYPPLLYTTVNHQIVPVVLSRHQLCVTCYAVLCCTLVLV